MPMLKAGESDAVVVCLGRSSELHSHVRWEVPTWHAAGSGGNIPARLDVQSVVCGDILGRPSEINVHSDHGD